jgi:proteic killer suppression protein
MLRLRSLDDLVVLSEIARLKGTGLHKLTGSRKNQWAMTINGPWRLVFEFRNGNAYNVEIVDYH